MRTLHAILPAAVFGCLLTAPVALAAPGNSEDKKLNLPSSDEPAEAVAQSSAGGSIVRTIAGLAIVLGVIYGLYWVLKQIKASKDYAAVSGTGLEALATMPLGTNRALHLVRAGREIVLIGTAENAIAPIRRYSEDEAYALGLIEPVAPASAGASLESLAPARPKGLMDILRSKTVVK
jgi:flagellar protein FliO/FliZ